MHLELVTGEPCALKGASTVRGGVDAKVPSQQMVTRWQPTPRLYDTDLVDGQPRGTRPAQRPATAAPAPRPVAAQSAPRPVAAQPAPAAPAPRPIAAQPATAPVQAAAVNAELASDQQKQAIRKMALQRSMNNTDVENQLQRLYGSDMNGLTKADAADFLKRLNSSAA
jgi:hypothetical protein